MKTQNSFISSTMATAMQSCNSISGECDTLIDNHSCCTSSFISIPPDSEACFESRLENINSILQKHMPENQFCYDDAGYCIAKETKKLTNFWVIPITEHRYHSRINSTYTLSLLFVTENSEKEIQTSLTELRRKGWLSKHLGACSGFYMEPSASNHIFSIIQLLCAHLSTIEIKDHYKYDGFSPDYTLYSKRGTVITSTLFSSCMQEAESRAKLMESAKLVDKTVLSCLRHEKMLSLLAVRVLAPFATQLSMEKKIDLFLLNIVGQSGTRKTTLCEQLFCGGEKTDISFSLSTTKAFEKKMKKNSDRVVIFDDAHPVTGTAKKRDFENKLELLCRTAGDAGTRETANEMFAASDIHCCIPALTGEIDKPQPFDSCTYVYRTASKKRGESRLFQRVPKQYHKVRVFL